MCWVLLQVWADTSLVFVWIQPDCKVQEYPFHHSEIKAMVFPLITGDMDFYFDYYGANMGEDSIYKYFTMTSLDKIVLKFRKGNVAFSMP